MAVQAFEVQMPFFASQRRSAGHNRDRLRPQPGCAIGVTPLPAARAGKPLSHRPPPAPMTEHSDNKVWHGRRGQCETSQPGCCRTTGPGRTTSSAKLDHVLVAAMGFARSLGLNGIAVSPPGLGRHEVSPSGPSTRSTGNRLATTTKLRSAAFTIAAAGRLTRYRTRAARRCRAGARTVPGYQPRRRGWSAASMCRRRGG
jgi:hypothetical protein